MTESPDRQPSEQQRIERLIQHCMQSNLQDTSLFSDPAIKSLFSQAVQQEFF